MAKDDANQLSLFGGGMPAARPELVGPALGGSGGGDAGLGRGVAGALPRGVRLGTSSWSFGGWAGLVYDRAAPAETLARHGLHAYAQHALLRTVGLDRTYYTPMEEPDLRALAAAVPAGFTFLVKAHQAVTVPEMDGDGGSGSGGGGGGRVLTVGRETLRIAAEGAGTPRGVNPLFLDSAYTLDRVVGPVLRGLGAAAGPILFQFSPMRLRSGVVGGVDGFLRRLDRFLGELPPGPLYGVEVRNAELLTPEYAAVLRRHGIVNGYCVHPTLPHIAEQVRLIDPGEQRALVVRWMLHATQSYVGAKARYAPFNRLVDEDEPTRDVIARLCAEAARRWRETWVIANNKAEGSAPLTLVRLAERVVERMRVSVEEG